MSFILLYVVFLVTYIYFICKRESYYFDIQYRVKHKHPNLHPMFSIERSALFSILLTIGFFNGLKIIPGLFLALTSLLCFDFLHNGFLYTFRNNLNPKVYLERFKANESDTSEALTDKLGITTTYKERKKLFIAGLFTLIISLILQNSL